MTTSMLQNVYRRALSTPHQRVTREQFDRCGGPLSDSEREHLTTLATMCTRGDKAGQKLLTKIYHTLPAQNLTDGNTNNNNAGSVETVLREQAEQTYGTRFVQSIQIKKFVRTTENTREGMTPYYTTYHWIDFTLICKLGGETRPRQLTCRIQERNNWFDNKNTPCWTVGEKITFT